MRIESQGFGLAEIALRRQLLAIEFKIQRTDVPCPDDDFIGRAHGLLLRCRQDT